MIFSTIESHATSLSIVEKITSNGYVYAELWPNPHYASLDYLFFRRSEEPVIPHLPRGPGVIENPDTSKSRSVYPNLHYLVHTL